MFDIALGIFLFLSPIFSLSLGEIPKINGIITALQFYQFKSLSMNSNILQLQFFQYGVTALFILSLLTQPVREFKDKYFVWFLGLCFISVFGHPKTINNFWTVFLGGILYYLAVTRTKNISNIFNAIILVSILNTLFALLQFFKIYLPYIPFSSSAQTGLMFHPAHLGLYQAIALPICYFVHPLFAIIPLIGLVLSKSLLAVFAAIAGIGYFMWHRIVDKGTVIIMALLSLLSIFIIRNYSLIIYKFKVRGWFWAETFKEIIKNPFGYGIGIFKMFKPGLGQNNNSYSLYLDIGYALGILGLIILFLFLKDKWKVYKTKISRAIFASCLTFAIAGLGLSFMNFPRLSGTAIILFAFLTIQKGESDEYYSDSLQRRKEFK